jgi:hypothetical protein
MNQAALMAIVDGFNHWLLKKGTEPAEAPRETGAATASKPV